MQQHGGFRAEGGNHGGPALEFAGERKFKDARSVAAHRRRAQLRQSGLAMGSTAPVPSRSNARGLRRLSMTVTAALLM